MTEKRRKAINVLNGLREHLNEDDYFLLLDFIVEYNERTYPFNPCPTNPCPLDPFYRNDRPDGPYILPGHITCDRHSDISLMFSKR